MLITTSAGMTTLTICVLIYSKGCIFFTWTGQKIMFLFHQAVLERIIRYSMGYCCGMALSLQAKSKLSGGLSLQSTMNVMGEK